MTKIPMKMKLLVMLFDKVDFEPQLANILFQFLYFGSLMKQLDIAVEKKVRFCLKLKPIIRFLKSQLANQLGFPLSISCCVPNSLGPPWPTVSPWLFHLPLLSLCLCLSLKDSQTTEEQPRKKTEIRGRCHCHILIKGLCRIPET